MKNINLIPAPRRAAKRCRVHLRRCAALCAGWLVLSVGAAAAAQAVWRGEDPQAGDKLARVNEEIERTQHSLADAQAQLAKVQSALRANQTIAAQPDWSIVLALLGQEVKGDVMLKGCQVRPAGGPRGPIAAPRADGRRTVARLPDAPAVVQPSAEVTYVLEAHGLADDPTAANDFVLRLENCPVFSKVTLLDTSRDAFLEKNKVAFRLECTLGKPTKSQAPASAQVAAPAGGAGATGSE